MQPDFSKEIVEANLSQQLNLSGLVLKFKIQLHNEGFKVLNKDYIVYNNLVNLSSSYYAFLNCLEYFGTEAPAEVTIA